MSYTHRWRRIESLAAILSVTSVSLAQSIPDQQVTDLVVDAKVVAVTAYRGRAAVTRSATVQLEAGVYELHFENLNETVLPETFQARASGPVTVVGVDYSQEQVTSPPPQFVELDSQIESLQRTLKEIEEQRKLIQQQEAVIDAMSGRAAADANHAAGTAELDLDAVAKQLAFWGEQRAKHLDERRALDVRQRDVEKQLNAAQTNRKALAGGSMVNRAALVSVVATAAGPVTLELTYLVSNATWEPVYNIRASLDGSAAQIEYDAMLTQRTGENWENVSLTLSTAQPTIAANPPALQPWFVDIVRPEEQVPQRGLTTGHPMTPDSRLRDRAEDKFKDLAALEDWARDADVVGGGPSVSYVLPRRVSIASNIEKQQRTRIATITANPQFVHVATPALTEAVYIRGTLTNGSAYQLLPGRAAIFVGQDYVGPTILASVAPGGEFKLHFGIDQSVKATRQLVSKRTENTGLLGGGRRTSSEYRIVVDNGSGKSLAVELWDRFPVSRAGEIQVDLVDLSHPLATDALYVAEERPQGLLKWGLSIAANASGRNAAVVTYGVRINRAKDVEMTNLPE
jgi:uncharacterized protein (TIGR02231 family)